MMNQSFQDLLARLAAERGTAGMYPVAAGANDRSPFPIDIRPASAGRSAPVAPPEARAARPPSSGGILERLISGFQGLGGSSGAQVAPAGGQGPSGPGNGFMSGILPKAADFAAAYGLASAFGGNTNQAFGYGLQGLYGGIADRRARKEGQAELNRTRMAAIKLGVPEEVAMNAPSEVLMEVIKEAHKAGLKAREPITTDKPIYENGEWILPPGYDPNRSGDRAFSRQILLSPDGKQQRIFDLNTPQGAQSAQAYMERGWVDPQALRNEGEGREFKQEDMLRDAYLKQVKPFTDLTTNYRRIEAAGQDQTGASDIAMVYSFMKMLDPTSVVREGEFATAENAGGVDSKVVTLYNRILSGERLSPQVRSEFMQQAGRQMESQWQAYDQIRKQWEDLAAQYQLDPVRVVPDVSYGLGRPKPPPQKKTEADTPTESEAAVDAEVEDLVEKYKTKAPQ